MTDAELLAPILVPFDGSAAAEAALPFAAAFAGIHGRVVLVQVIAEPQPIRDVLGDVVLNADRLLSLTRDAAVADLERAAALLARQDPRLSIETRVEVGDPATATVDLAARLRPRLIVVTVRGRGETPEGDLGSVVDRLAGAAPAPLLIVNPSGANERPSRLVVGLDGSEHAQAASTLAAEFAQRHDLPIHLVSVLEAGWPEALPIDRPELLDARLAGGLLADARRDAQRTVEAAGANLMRKGIQASWETRAGAPAAELTAPCGPGDVLVIASHGRRGAIRWGLGSVARRLIQGSKLPTLLVRTAPPEPQHVGADRVAAEAAPAEAAPAE